MLFCMEGYHAEALRDHSAPAPLESKEVRTRQDSLYHIFKSEPETFDWELVATENKAAAEREQGFDIAIDGLLKKHSTKEARLGALRKFAFELHPPQTLRPSELMRVLNAFKDNDSFEDVAQLYENAKDKRFTQAPLVQEFYAVALNKTNRTEESIGICEKLIESGNGNGEVYGALGKAHKIRFEASKKLLALKQDPRAQPEELAKAQSTYTSLFPHDAEMRDVESNYQRSYEKSFGAYEKGYLCDFEYYPGINAVYLAMEAGPEWEKKAERMAKLVRWSALNDGGVESDDYWCAVTMLESALILKDSSADIEKMLNTVLLRATKSWEVDTTLEHLNKLYEKRAGKDSEHSGSKTKDEHNHIEQLGRTIAALSKRLDEIDKGVVTKEPPREAPRDHRNAITKKIDEASFTYQGLTSNFISGNFNFEGQLHDRAVNRTDVKIFDNLLKFLKLDEVSDISKFNEIVDTFIRGNYGTSSLEDLVGPAHHIYDETVKKFIEWSGITTKKNADSRTNISVDLITGVGDCRHHADSKQMFYDRWQRSRVNRILREQYFSLLNNEDKDGKALEDSIRQVKDIRKTEMRTFHVVVSGPVDTAGLNSPLRTPRGNLKKRFGSDKPVENHTMTMLIERKDNGNIRNVKLADSFYQEAYPFHRGRLNPGDVLSKRGFKLSVAGEGLFGRSVRIPMRLSFASYSKKTDRPDTKYYGDLLFRGRPIEGNAPVEQIFSQQGQEKIHQHISRFRQYAGISGNS